MSSNDVSTAEHSHVHHITPLWIYVGVWLALMFLTAVTVWVAQFDFGAFNAVVAMGVATVKASLVALIFMGLWWDERFNLLAFVGSLVFVGLFFLFTFADEMTRGQIDPIEANFVKEMPAADTAYKRGKRPEHHEAAPAGHGSEAAPAAGH